MATEQQRTTTYGPKDKGNGAVSATQPGASLAINQASLVDVVGVKVNNWLVNGEIVLPADYSVDNAMKFAYLALQEVKDRDGKAALEVCTEDSIVNALLTMAVQGLSVGKNQGFFIVFAGKLTFQRSYFGTMALTMMVQPAIKDFAYAVVYQGDKFTYGIKLGKKMVTSHEQDIDNVHKDKIKAAYAIALNERGEPLRSEIMTYEEIQQSWKQSKQNPFDEKGQLRAGTVHSKFTADMSLRTVINKLCKPIINTSTDKQILLDMIKRSEELADRALVEEEIEEAANKGPVLDITDKAPSTGDPPAQDVKENGTGVVSEKKTPYETIKAALHAAKTSKELAEAGRMIDGPEGNSLSAEEVKELKELGQKRLDDARVKKAKPKGIVEGGEVKTGGEQKQGSVAEDTPDWAR